MKHGTTVIAFVEDSNGYKVKLIECGWTSGAVPDSIQNCS